jgi:hypothetical protein
MTRTELIIQLLKVAIALAFGAYFVWWSLQVLDRLTPDYDAATTMVGLFFKFNASPVGAARANGGDGCERWLSDSLRVADRRSHSCICRGITDRFTRATS